jgi:hypothetical protein
VEANGAQIMLSLKQIGIAIFSLIGFFSFSQFHSFILISAVSAPPVGSTASNAGIPVGSTAANAVLPVGSTAANAVIPVGSTAANAGSASSSPSLDVYEIFFVCGSYVSALVIQVLFICRYRVDAL